MHESRGPGQDHPRAAVSAVSIERDRMGPPVVNRGDDVEGGVSGMPGGRNDKRRDSDSGVGDGGGADRAGSADGVDEGPMVEETDDEAARMSPGRLEAFSDGVIAIAITLLSLEIRLPEDLSLLDGLSSLWPSYVGFVLSFLLIGQVWLNHHAIFQRIRYVDQWVLVWNLLLLLDVAFLPFATTVLTRALKTGGEARAGAVFYGLVMMFGGFFNGLWQAAIRDRGCLRPGVPDAVVRAMTRRFAMGPILYAIAAAVSMVSAWLSVTTYLLLIVFYTLGGSRRRGGSREPRRSVGAARAPDRSPD